MDDKLGKRYGTFIVENFHNKEKRQARWNCKCDCGAYKVFWTSQLKAGAIPLCDMCRIPVEDKHNNLCNTQIGNITMVEYLGCRSRRHYWKCKCVCGAEFTTYETKIFNKKSKCCKSCNRVSPLPNLTGTTFGLYSVIEFVGTDERGSRLWKSKCSCGKIQILSSSHLGRLHETSNCGCRKDLMYPSGSNSSKWNSLLSDKERTSRRPHEFKIWRKLVFDRDNYTCQLSNEKGGKLCAHHILSWNSHPELRYETSNGITIRQDLHRKFHSIYGSGNNTAIQWNEFKENYKN